MMKNNDKIVKCFGMSKNNNNNKFYILLEYIPDGSLYQYMDNIQRNKNIVNIDIKTELKFIFLRIVHAMITFHSYKMLHLDLKPQNILIKKRNFISPIICDFGSSIPFENIKNELITINNHEIGTLKYSAPEIILTMATIEQNNNDPLYNLQNNINNILNNNNNNKKSIGFACIGSDLYSLGIILSFLFGFYNENNNLNNIPYCNYNKSPLNILYHMMKCPNNIQETCEKYCKDIDKNMNIDKDYYKLILHLCQILTKKRANYKNIVKSKIFKGPNFKGIRDKIKNKINVINKFNHSHSNQQIDNILINIRNNVKKIDCDYNYN